jgi:hypothetical protein
MHPEVPGATLRTWMARMQSAFILNVELLRSEPPLDGAADRFNASIAHEYVGSRAR